MTWQWVTVILGLAFLTFAFFGFALVVIGRAPRSAGSVDAAGADARDAENPAPRKDRSTEETQVIKP